MIGTILPYLQTSESRAVRLYTQFKEEQMRIVYRQYRRIFKSLGHESYGVRLLRYILQFVDHKYLDSRANNYQRYTDHLRLIRRDLMNIFDRVRYGRGYYNFFFEKNDYATEEFILPVEDVNTIVNLPLDSDRWSDWRHVHPVRIWSHDSDELSMNLLNGRVHFSTLPPTRAVILLDVIGLVFKYYIWNKYERMNEPAKNLADEVPQQLFLNKYVICDLHWDLLDVWLIRNLRRVMQCESREEVEEQFSSQELQMDSVYGRIGVSSRKGYVDLWKTMTVSTVIPAVILNSLLLSRGSPYHRLNELENKLMMPRNSAYNYLKWIRDKDTLEWIVALFNRRPTLPATVSLKRKLSAKMDRLIRERPWNICSNVMLKSSIENEMHAFVDLLHQ